MTHAHGLWGFRGKVMEKAELLFAELFHHLFSLDDQLNIAQSVIMWSFIFISFQYLLCLWYDLGKNMDKLDCHILSIYLWFKIVIICCNTSQVQGTSLVFTDYFQCDPSNLGVFSFQRYLQGIEDTAGRWLYLITKSNTENVDVTVRVSARKDMK